MPAPSHMPLTHGPPHPQITRGWAIGLEPDEVWKDPTLDVFNEEDVAAAAALAQQVRALAWCPHGFPIMRRSRRDVTVVLYPQAPQVGGSAPKGWIPKGEDPSPAPPPRPHGHILLSAPMDKD